MDRQIFFHPSRFDIYNIAADNFFIMSTLVFEEKILKYRQRINTPGR